MSAVIGGRVGAIAGSGIRAVAAAAWARPGTVHLEFGEPADDTPPHVVEAAAAAARNGRTRYGPTAGLSEFREAVAGKLVRDNGWMSTDARPELVVTTAGGVGALHAAYCALLDAGDEILVPDPGWPNFVALARLVDAVPVAYRLDPATGAPPATAELDALLTPRTRAVVVNSPANPTGAVWSPEQLATVGEWAASRGLTVVSDECYDRLGLDGPITGMAVAAPQVKTVSVFSLSKSYAMTGWRIGYAVAPAELATAMVRVQETMASCVSTVAQLAGVAALTGPQDDVARMRADYVATRDRALEVCRSLDLSVLRPGGAFYLWVRLPDPAADATRFAFDLIERAGVAVAPGPAFGPAGAGHVRLSLAASVDDVLHGLRAIHDLAREAA